MHVNLLSAVARLVQSLALKKVISASPGFLPQNATVFLLAEEEMDIIRYSGLQGVEEVRRVGRTAKNAVFPPDGCQSKGVKMVLL